MKKIRLSCLIDIFRFFCVVTLLFPYSLCLAISKERDSPFYILQRKCSDFLDKLDYKKSLELADSLVKIANFEDNEEYKAYAYLDRGTARLFSANWSDAWSDLDKAFEYATLIQNDSLKALTLNCQGIFAAYRQGNIYMGQQLFLKSLEYAKEIGMRRLIPSLYNNIAQSAILQNDTTGIYYAIEQLKLARKSLNRHDEYLALINMGKFYHLKGDDKEAFKCVVEGLEVQNAHGFTNHGDLERLKIEILIQRDQISEAERLLEKLIKRLKEESPNDIPETLLLKARLLYKKKEYRESLDILNKLTADPGAKPLLQKVYWLMSQIYTEKNDFAGATRSLYAYIDNMNVLHASERELLVNERKLLIDIVQKENQLELDAIKINNRNKLITAMIIIIILAFIIIMIGISSHNKRKKLYRGIVSQYSDAINREKNLEDLVAKYRTIIEQKEQDDKKYEVEALVPDLKADEIFEKLCRCVEDERLYADATFTREQLLEKIGTNRTYLSKIIKEKTGNNYSQFMNQFRVREAMRILSDLNRNDYVLKDIYLEIGFISKSSFYKVFKETVGLTPRQFRDQYRDMYLNNKD